MKNKKFVAQIAALLLLGMLLPSMGMATSNDRLYIGLTPGQTENHVNVDFGECELGKTVEKTVYLSVPNTALDFSITDEAQSGPQSGPYLEGSCTVRHEDGWDPMNGGAVTITFAPSTIQSYSGRFYFVSKNPNGTGIVYSAAVDITGSGIASTDQPDPPGPPDQPDPPGPPNPPAPPAVNNSSTDTFEPVSRQNHEKATVVKAKNGADIRVGPGKSYDVIGQVKNGETIELLEWNANESWCKVLYNNGNNLGWLYYKYIEPIK